MGQFEDLKPLNGLLLLILHTYIFWWRTFGVGKNTGGSVLYLVFLLPPGRVSFEAKNFPNLSSLYSIVVLLEMKCNFMEEFILLQHKNERSRVVKSRNGFSFWFQDQNCYKGENSRVLEAIGIGLFLLDLALRIFNLPFRVFLPLYEINST
jgi:hypothetical protein